MLLPEAANNLARSAKAMALHFHAEQEVSVLARRKYGSLLAHLGAVVKLLVRFGGACAYLSISKVVAAVGYANLLLITTEILSEVYHSTCERCARISQHRSSNGCADHRELMCRSTTTNLTSPG